MYKRKITLIFALTILTTGCFEEQEDIEVLNPQSMEDCIPINNSNKRDQCKMKVTVLLNKKSIEARKKSLGSPNI